MATSMRRFARFTVVASLVAISLALVGCRSDSEKLEGFMTRADEYREAKSYDEAIIEYRNALQVDPNHAAAHEGLAESYLGAGKIKEAYWELGETIRLDPDNVDARLSYATISLAARRHEEVLEQAEAVVELAPDNPAGHLLLGQSYANLERWDEVEAPLLSAVELEPDDGSYRAVIGTFYGSRGRMKEAEDQLRIGIERDPSPLLHGMLARMLFEQERFDEAEQAFSNAIERAHVDTDALGPDQPDTAAVAEAYQNLASFYFQRDDPEQGIATLERGIERSRNRGELIALLARYYRSEGEDEKANALLLDATEVDPTDPEPYLRVSTLRGLADDLDGALEFAEKAVAADPNHVKARLRKAEVLIDMGVRADDTARVSEGRTIVEEVLSEDPTDPDGLFVLSKLEIATGNVDAGIEAIRSALDSKPSWAQGHYVLGSALVLKGEPQRARAELARAVELAPTFADARQLLIKTHADLGEYEYAIENGQRYLKGRPTDDRTRLIVAQSLVRLGKVDEAIELVDAVPPERRTVDVLFAIGRLQSAKGDADGALETLVAANELRPNDPRILGALVDIDRAKGTLGHSIKRVNDAVAARPEDANLWRLKGRIAMSSGDLDSAEKSLQKAIELDSGNLAAYQYLAQLYAGTGRTAETIGLYEQAVEKQPKNAGAHHFLGVLYEMTGSSDKARDQYEVALTHDPTLGESKNNLAYLMAESGEDLDRALKLAQEAKAAMPDSPNAADTLGWVLYKRGVASAAVGYLREAVQVANPDDPAIGEIRTHLSLAYEATGEVDKAIESLEMALSDLERLKESGRLRQDPSWATDARASIERLKSAG